MPPKSKRKIQLEEARAAKVSKSSESFQAASQSEVSEPPLMPSQPSTSSGGSAGQTSSSPMEHDPEIVEDFDERSTMASFASEWVETLSRDDLLSLSVLLWHLLTGILSFKITEAAELIGRAIGKSDRTIREWKKTFNANRGSFPDTLQGKYQRDGILWQNEDLNKRAVKYVRENAVVKGKPNLTAGSFCQWINECLLVNQTVSTAHQYRNSSEIVA